LFRGGKGIDLNNAPVADIAGHVWEYIWMDISQMRTE